jgi:hypothetical protein
VDVLFQPYSITEEEKDKLAINPGQLIYTIDTHKVYLDYYNENNEAVRGEFGGGGTVGEIIIPRTTAIDFDDTGFNLSYAIGDEHFPDNDFDIIYKTESDGRTQITQIVNKKTKDVIDISGLFLNEKEELSVEAITIDEIDNILANIKSKKES